MSAALPVLWALIESRGWSHARLANELDLDGGRVARLLYGDRKPGRELAVRLRDLGIEIELWDQPIEDGWLPPHVDVARAS